MLEAAGKAEEEAMVGAGKAEGEVNGFAEADKAELSGEEEG
jgi:hypothetical protein